MRSKKGEEDMRREKRVSDSSVETMHAVRPVHLNGAGRLFGGQLMEWLDEVERSMVYYMPLSSLRSFTKLDNEGLGELVDELKNHVR